MLLTKRQKQILTFLTTSVSKNGYAPSMAEIGRHFGLHSISTIHKHLVNLEQKGCIKRDPNRARAIEIVGETSQARELLVVGTVAAGEPIEPARNAELVTVPESMLVRGEHTVLRARGSSLVDEDIRDGDLIVVEKRSEAVDGETVVALLEGERVTLRKYFRDQEKIRLQSARRANDELWLEPADVTIRFVVTGVLRKY